MKFPVLISAALGIVVSTLLNLVIMTFAAPFSAESNILKPFAVIFWSLLGGIGATTTYLIIRKLSKTPEKRFIQVAAGVLLLSFIPDAMLIGLTNPSLGTTTPPGIFALMLMHVISAGSMVAALTKFSKK